MESQNYEFVNDFLQTFIICTKTNFNNENITSYKTEVINDPLGQPTVPAGSACRFISKFWDGRTDVRTLCVK